MKEGYVQDPDKSTVEGRSGPTRRDFLSAGLSCSVAGLLGPALTSLAGVISGENHAPERSVVHKIYSRRVLSGLKVNPARLRIMLDQTIKAASGCDRLTDAWRSFIRPEWKVLLKFTRFIGVETGAEQAMLNAVLESLESARFDLANICVVGNDYARRHPRLIQPAAGWSDRTVVVEHRGEQVRKYLDNIDAIVNIPSLLDHVQAGVSCAMLNVSVPFIRRPGAYEGSAMHRMIADVCASAGPDKPIAPVVLTLVNALQSLYGGGPRVVGAWMEATKQLWASTDMVAVDSLARQWIDKRRRREGMADLASEGRAPEYITLADKMGLGKSSPRAIKIEPLSL